MDLEMFEGARDGQAAEEALGCYKTFSSSDVRAILPLFCPHVDLINTYFSVLQPWTFLQTVQCS